MTDATYEQLSAYYESVVFGQPTPPSFAYLDKDFTLPDGQVLKAGAYFKTDAGYDYLTPDEYLEMMP